MTDHSKRLLAWFAVTCLGSCLAMQYFTGYPIKFLQLEEGKR